MQTDATSSIPSRTDNYNLLSMQDATNYNCAILAFLRKHATKSISILDFGAGRGVFANEFVRPITCIEPNEKLARDIAPRHMVLPNLGIVRGLFDMVYSINVLEHIYDDTETLRDLRALMLRGGRLLLFVPARMELYSMMDMSVGHYRRYEPAQLKQLLEKTGFHVDALRYFDFAGYWATLFCKASGRLIRWQGGLSQNCVSFYDKVVFPVSRVMDTMTAGSVIGKNILVEAKAV